MGRLPNNLNSCLSLTLFLVAALLPKQSTSFTNFKNSIESFIALSYAFTIFASSAACSSEIATNLLDNPQHPCDVWYSHNESHSNLIRSSISDRWYTVDVLFLPVRFCILSYRSFCSLIFIEYH